MVSYYSWGISDPYRWLSYVSSFLDIFSFLWSVEVTHEMLNIDGKGAEASKTIHELVIHPWSRDNLLFLSIFFYTTFGKKADTLILIFL